MKPADKANIDPSLPKGLRRIYREIPDVGCKGLCWKSCNRAPCNETELEAVFRYVGTRERHARPGLLCPYLTDENRCGCYAVRPLVCRLYGAVHQLQCPFGCKPAGGLMNHKKEGALMLAAAELDPSVRSLDPIVDGILLLADKDGSAEK